SRRRTGAVIPTPAGAAGFHPVQERQIVAGRRPEGVALDPVPLAARPAADVNRPLARVHDFQRAAARPAAPVRPPHAHGHPPPGDRPGQDLPFAATRAAAAPASCPVTFGSRDAGRVAASGRGLSSRVVTPSRPSSIREEAAYEADPIRMTDAAYWAAAIGVL